jgi:hypothetical protein
MLFVFWGAYSEPITSLVEFFSFRCLHCANVNPKVAAYVNSHKIQFTDVNVDVNELALPTTIMYYLAIDAGVGPQFKNAYFAVVASGMPAYTPSTLNYVVNQIKNTKLTQLMKSKDEPEQIKQKLIYANKLLTNHHIQATPSFLINQTILLEGEDVINSLNYGIK